MDNVCKICFKDIQNYSLFSITNRKNILCENCFGKMNAKFIAFNIGSVKGIAIYEYDETIKELIYKYKGCYDYELKDIFLYRYLTYLRIKYHGYIVVPAPSYYLDDEKRGFNHVIEIYKASGLKMEPVIHKIKSHKQSENNSKKRKSIKSILSIDEKCELKGKKILLVDDIMTTGSTLLSCIELLRSKIPKKIEILVIAKTKKLEKTEY